MNQFELDVRHFMEATGQDAPGVPTAPPEKIRELRAKLIMEEALEQCAALGVTVCESGSELGLGDIALEFHANDPADLVEIADSTCDQLYVTIGTAIACGIQLPRIWNFVHGSNLAKFGPGSHRRDDGKVMKPANWLPPTADIKADILLQQTTDINTESWMPVAEDWDRLNENEEIGVPVAMVGPKNGRWVYFGRMTGGRWMFDPVNAYERKNFEPTPQA